MHVSPAGEPVAQYALDDVEELGFLKVDVLGLRKLTIIEEAVGAAARDGYWLPPTYHPAAAFYREELREVIQADLHRLGDLLGVTAGACAEPFPSRG